MWVCVCAPCVAARKSLLLKFYLVCVFYGLVHKAHTHTHIRPAQPHTHAQSISLKRFSLLCRHFLCASLSVRACASVCVGGSRPGAWGHSLLSSLSLLCSSYSRSAPPSTKPFSLSVFTCILYENFTTNLHIHIHIRIYVCVLVSVCERQIYANFKCFLFVMNLTSM